jgi:pyruvate/2-oxoglutarate dehydrogenase complex dihydrolipoamide acyltransferase (E2) component
VKRLGASEGVVLKVGEVVCDIETEAGEAEAEEKQEDTANEETVHKVEKPETSAPSPPMPEPTLIIEDESLHNSRDDLLDTTGGAQFSGEAAMLPSPPPARPSHSHSHSHTITQERRETKPWNELRKIVKASPAVRTLAARMGIDLMDIKGSGEGGRVLRDDITSHITGSSLSVDVDGQAPPGARDEVPTTTRVEFGRTRKVMYRAMGDMGSVPHFG